MVSQKYFHINRKLLFYKAHYAFFHGGGASIVYFLPIFLKDFGVSAAVTGVIYTILPFIGILAHPLVSGLADRFNKQRLVLIISIVLMLLLVFSINFIPPIPCTLRKPSFQSNCNSSYLDLQICDTRLNNDNSSYAHCLSCALPYFNNTCLQRFGYNLDTNNSNWSTNVSDHLFLLDYYTETKSNSCEHYHLNIFGNDEISQCYSMTCNNTVISKCINECLPQEEIIPNLYSTYQFWWLALAIIIKGINNDMATCIGDTVLYNFLGENKEKYGYQRVWGTISNGLMNLISGFLIDRATDVDGKTHYTAAFYLFVSLMLMDCVTAFFLDIVPQEINPNIVQNVWKHINNARGLVFFTVMFFIGMISGIMDSFLFWYLEDLGGSKVLMGTVTVVQCFCGEMLFMILSGIIIKKIGHFNTLTLTLTAYGLRYILYSFLINPWFILPVELLHGFCFGVFWPAATSYATTLAAPGITTTIQGIMSAVNSGAGAGMGSLLGGFIYDKVGGRQTFRIFGVVSLVCAVLHAIASYWIYRRMKNQSTALNPDNKMYTVCHKEAGQDRQIDNSKI